MSLFKEFLLSRLREGMHLEFRAEAFNLFNHPQFQGPDTLVGDSNFGVITSTVNKPPRNAVGPEAVLLTRTLPVRRNNRAVLRLRSARRGFRNVELACGNSAWIQGVFTT